MANIFSPLLHNRITQRTLQRMHTLLYPISLYLLSTDGTLPDLRMKCPFRITTPTLRYHLSKLISLNLKEVKDNTYITKDKELKECAKTLLSVVYNAIQTNKSAEIQIESARDTRESGVFEEEDIDGLLEDSEMEEFGEEDLADPTI